MATDADENDMLTYTLWYGTSADSITTKGKSTNPTKQGETVRIEQNVGLSNDTEYWFKVVVTDGMDEITSDKCNESTYCKGEYCEGVSYSYEACTRCDSNHKITCTKCSGLGYTRCGRMLSIYRDTYDTVDNATIDGCYICNRVISGGNTQYYYVQGYCTTHRSE